VDPTNVPSNLAPMPYLFSAGAQSVIAAVHSPTTIRGKNRESAIAR